MFYKPYSFTLSKSQLSTYKIKYLCYDIYLQITELYLLLTEEEFIKRQNLYAGQGLRLECYTTEKYAHSTFSSSRRPFWYHSCGTCTLSLASQIMCVILSVDHCLCCLRHWSVSSSWLPESGFHAVSVLNIAPFWIEVPSECNGLKKSGSNASVLVARKSGKNDASFYLGEARFIMLKSPQAKEAFLNVLNSLIHDKAIPKKESYKQ